MEKIDKDTLQRIIKNTKNIETKFEVMLEIVKEMRQDTSTLLKEHSGRLGSLEITMKEALERLEKLEAIHSQKGK